MEKIKDTESTIEVFEDDIKLYLSMYCDEYNVDDIRKASQSVWNGALRYIRRHVFSRPDILKSNSKINIYNNKIPSNFNAYNYNIVNDVCDIYIDLCCIYDKEISIMGFSNLTGINTDTINEWGNQRVKLDSMSTAIYRKLHKSHEESLSNKLVTGKQNPIGVLGVLNRHFAWNMPGVRQGDDGRKAMTAAEVAAQIETELNEKSKQLVIEGDAQAGINCIKN